jgi:hypothetical protein
LKPCFLRYCPFEARRSDESNFSKIQFLLHSFDLHIFQSIREVQNISS